MVGGGLALPKRKGGGGRRRQGIPPPLHLMKPGVQFRRNTHRDRNNKLLNGPNVGKRATYPLPSWGYPNRGQNSKMPTWPMCGQNGYVAPAVLGIPKAGQNQKLLNGWILCLGPAKQF